MAINEGMCGTHNAHSSCMKEYLAYPTQEKKCPRCRYGEEFEFESMFGKRIENMGKEHYSAIEFASTHDEASSAATLARPVDAATFKDGEKKD